MDAFQGLTEEPITQQSASGKKKSFLKVLWRNELVEHGDKVEIF